MSTREHKLVLGGENCIMLGIAHNFPSGTVRVRNEKTGKIAHCQNVLWHPETREPQGSSGSAVESEERKATTHHNAAQGS